jgi:hypothetical protein
VGDDRGRIGNWRAPGYNNPASDGVLRESVPSGVVSVKNVDFRMPTSGMRSRQLLRRDE